MTPFEFLFISHLIGDYLLQTNWMAMNKAKKWLPLLSHCIVYTLTVSIIAFLTFGGLSTLAIIFIFLSHVLLDRRTFVTWWAEKVMGAVTKESSWLKIVVDQVFHLIILAVALYL